MKNILKSVEQMVKIATAINANNRLILDFRFWILGMHEEELAKDHEKREFGDRE